jgi:hypothetical protein
MTVAAPITRIAAPALILQPKFRLIRRKIAALSCHGQGQKTPIGE